MSYHEFFGLQLSACEDEVANLFFNDIHKGSNLYLYPDIPEKKLEAAKRTYAPVVKKDGLLALADNTVFGAADEGLVLTLHGIYWTEVVMSSKGTYLPYKEIFEVAASTSLSFKGGGRGIKVNGTRWISLACLNSASILELANFIESASEICGKYCVDSEAAVGEPEKGDNRFEEWFISVNGQTYGPYHLDTIKALVSSKQIQPDTCLGWKDGMANWLDFMDISELANLVRTGPPPLPSPSLPPTREQLEPMGGLSVSDELHGLLNINIATVDELLGLPGINLDQARFLVSQRERRRFFSSVEEVGELLQLQPHQVEKIRSRIVISALPGGGRRIDY
ncbi:hypothetical protein AXX12_07025 [Anaerosporomusa subterranea]|uniref:GYF domain-containing protein n=1 Tax=Anaerosporomusa subterranea TaxID=1794912 RepID=A0A154BQL2_ANASB|nr:GYF domain-containing protein [Anaerosporomusa subterranea]KYZ76189.1 hypothetical protein AXX12_07025 [Anaerosporomusa subterranea]